MKEAPRHAWPPVSLRSYHKNCASLHELKTKPTLMTFLEIDKLASVQFRKKRIRIPILAAFRKKKLAIYVNSIGF